MSKEKTHWRTFHPSKYIGAADFSDAERKVLTIAKAGREGVKDNKGAEDICLVVHFKENEKPLICNVTNSKAIDKVAGSPMIEDWAGVKIELYTTTVNAFGDQVEAVRVKPTPPKTTKPALTPDHPAWDKVVASVAEGYTREQVESKYSVTDQAWSEIVGGK